MSLAIKKHVCCYCYYYSQSQKYLSTVLEVMKCLTQQTLLYTSKSQKKWNMVTIVYDSSQYILYMCNNLWTLPIITFCTKFTSEYVKRSCWMVQQGKVMYTALAYCSLLITLYSSRTIDFKVFMGLLWLIRLDSCSFAFHNLPASASAVKWPL